MSTDMVDGGDRNGPTGLLNILKFLGYAMNALETAKALSDSFHFTEDRPTKVGADAYFKLHNLCSQVSTSVELYQKCLEERYPNHTSTSSDGTDGP